MVKGDFVRWEVLKSARLAAGWSQHEAGARLGVSQPYYCQLENGARPLPDRLALRAARKLCVSPLVLPLPTVTTSPVPLESLELTSAVAQLGYPGFAHMKTKGQGLNPAELVARSLVHPNLDVRLVEALPWVLAEFFNLDWTWLVAQCRLLNLQNRLGYVTALARQLAKPGTEAPLNGALVRLEESRLAAEGTLCRDSMSDAERVWVRKHRSPEAAHWNMLTTLTADQLTHAA